MRSPIRGLCRMRTGLSNVLMVEGHVYPVQQVTSSGCVIPTPTVVYICSDTFSSLSDTKRAKCVPHHLITTQWKLTIIYIYDSSNEMRTQCAIKYRTY